MFKIKVILKSIAKRSKFLRKIMRFVFFTFGKFHYELISRNIEVDEKRILFACFQGKSYSDSPKALYEYILKNGEYKDYRLVWGFENPQKYSFLENNPNTRVVKIKSKEYLKELAKAKYWFINFKTDDHIFPKKNQVLLQCWHGTPLKRLGCDLLHFDNAMNTAKELSRRYEIETQKYSFFISPSRFASEKFVSAWNMKALGKENIILETGYPRNDFLYSFTEEDALRLKNNLGLPLDKKVILYAPTYRDNQHSVSEGYTYRLNVDFDFLERELKEDYVILFRAHYFVADSFNFEKYKGFVYDLSSYDDISELYVISDMLITDYSSVFFDYANLKRPIIFYMYDLESYRDEMRGFYLDLSELPSSPVQTEEELAERIKNAYVDEKYLEFRNRFCYLEDGKACERVIKAVLD